MGILVSRHRYSIIVPYLSFAGNEDAGHIEDLCRSTLAVRVHKLLLMEQILDHCMDETIGIVREASHLKSLAGFASPTVQERLDKLRAVPGQLQASGA